MSDVCAYRYALNEFEAPQILYKLDWKDDWHELPTRLNTDRKLWVSLFTERLAITKRKFQDLQAIKTVMPESVHHFFTAYPIKIYKQRLSVKSNMKAKLFQRCLICTF